MRMTTSTSGAGLPAPVTRTGGDTRLGEPRPARDGFVRDRQHRFPGRRNALKVLYDDVEVAAVRSAAEVAGLTPTGFVAAAGLTLAGAASPPALSADRQLLAELLQTRTALSRYGSNLNQAVAALHNGAGAPVWLLQAVAGCARAADGVDALTATLARRLR